MESISTKTGDKGLTGLANGQRLPKNSLEFEVIGNLDELNSWLGLVVAKLERKEFSLHQKFILQVQDTLFYLGAEVAKAPKVTLKKNTLTKLEKLSEKLQQSMEKDWHQKFLLPGGTEVAAWLDIARSVCRRAERSLITLNQKSEINPLLIKYVNRLSDYLYLLRCFVNQTLVYREKKFIKKV